MITCEKCDHSYFTMGKGWFCGYKKKSTLAGMTCIHGTVTFPEALREFPVGYALYGNEATE